MNKLFFSSHLFRTFHNYFKTVIKLAIVLLVLLTYELGNITVINQSMENTIFSGQHLLVVKSFFKPENGDIVVVKSPNIMEESTTEGTDYSMVTRIIAVGGQEIDIDFSNGKVYVDQKLIDEPYIKEKNFQSQGEQFPQVVPEGYVFVMSDNRNNSTDSRDPTIGMVDERYIYGEVVFNLTPLEKFGFVK